MNKTNLIQDLLDGNNYQLGPIIQLRTPGLAAAIPIIATHPPKRTYTTLPETNPENIQYHDTGTITNVHATTTTNKAIFIRAGTVLKGNGTQSRVTTHSTILTNEKNLHTRCVHASHPVNTGNTFTYIGTAPSNIEKTLINEGTQNQVWQQTATFTSTTHATTTNLADAMTHQYTPTNTTDTPPTPHESLTTTPPPTQEKTRPKTTDTVNQQVEEIHATIEDMGAYQNQTGIIILDTNGVTGLELFNHPDSWKAHYKDTLEKYIPTTTPKDTDTIYDINKEKALNKAKKFLKKILNTDTKTIEHTDTLQVEKFQHDLYGERVTLNNQDIFILARRKDPDTHTTSTESITTTNTVPTNFTINNPQTYTTNTSTPITNTYTTNTTSPQQKTTTLNIDKLLNDYVDNKKGMNDLLQQTKTGKTFTELNNTLNISKATLSKRLKEAQTTGLINKKINGTDNKPKYYSTTQKNKKRNR